MLDVAFSFRPVLWFAAVAGELCQQLTGFVQIEARSGGDVEDLSGNFFGRSVRGQQIRFDGVVDVGKVAALAAVAEDGGLLAVQHLRGELRQYARIRRRRILAWTKNVEVAQAYGFESVAAVERGHIVLAGKLRYGVGRDRIRRHRLLLG